MVYTVTYRIETLSNVFYRTCFEAMSDRVWKSGCIRDAIQRIKDEYKANEVAIVMMEKLD